MGREIRRVPPNWEHPRYTKDNARNERDIGEYMPMHDRTWAEAVREWKEGYAAWEAGTHESLKWYRENERDTEYWEYDSPPDREYYRPEFTGEPTWYQVYQTVSEGTPVTPPFPTKEALVAYLMEGGDEWDRRRGRGGYTREQAEAFVQDEHVPSLMISGGRVSEGIEISAALKNG